MFYSVFYQPKANFTLREEKKMNIIGYLVKIGRKYEIIKPSVEPCIKAGKKQFLFNYNQSTLQAVQQHNGIWYANLLK